MTITDVRVRKISNEGKMKAVASITLDEEFVVHDIKIIEGEKGLFIAMPSRKTAENEFRDIAHPIKADSGNDSESVRRVYQRGREIKFIKFIHLGCRLAPLFIWIKA